MTIRTSYKTTEEIPEAHRDLFEEQEDGTWVIQIEGAGPKTSADVTRLDAALKKERLAHKDTKKAILAFGETTPERVIELTDRVEELELQIAAGGGKPDDKALEPLIERRAESKVRPIQRELKTAQEELVKLRGENETLGTAAARRRMQDTLRAATIGEKGVKLRSPAALEDIELWAERVLEENESGVFVTRDGLTGIDPGLSAADLLRDVQQRGVRPHWFPDNEGAGADGGGARKQGTTGNDPFVPGADGKSFTVNMTEFQRVAKAEPKRARVLAQKHGRTDLVTMVDAMTGAGR
jgi:hypothetical protein